MDLTFDVQSIAAMTAGVLGTMGGGALAYSKVRRVLARDALDTSAHDSMKKAMESLREENSRLHDEVGRLRTEINRLQQVITDLTGQIAAMSLAMSRNSVEDQLAREGRLDRRRRVTDTTPFPVISGVPE